VSTAEKLGCLAFRYGFVYQKEISGYGVRYVRGTDSLHVWQTGKWELPNRKIKGEGETELKAQLKSLARGSFK